MTVSWRFTTNTGGTWQANLNEPTFARKVQDMLWSALPPPATATVASAPTVPSPWGPLLVTRSEIPRDSKWSQIMVRGLWYALATDQYPPPPSTSLFTSAAQNPGEVPIGVLSEAARYLSARNHDMAQGTLTGLSFSAGVPRFDQLVPGDSNVIEWVRLTPDTALATTLPGWVIPAAVAIGLVGLGTIVVMTWGNNGKRKRR